MWTSEVVSYGNALLSLACLRAVMDNCVQIRISTSQRSIKAWSLLLQEKSITPSLNFLFDQWKTKKSLTLEDCFSEFTVNHRCQYQWTQHLCTQRLTQLGWGQHQRESWYAKLCTGWNPHTCSPRPGVCWACRPRRNTYQQGHSIQQIQPGNVDSDEVDR